MVPMAELIKLVPQGGGDKWDVDFNEVTEPIDDLRKAVDNCPLCILAAIRKSKTYLSFNFNYKDEFTSWMSEWAGELYDYPR